LNSSAAHINALAALAIEHMGGWSLDSSDPADSKARALALGADN
jgi:hypothetical protein